MNAIERIIAMIWAVELAVAIDRYPWGVINGHRWPWSPYIVCKHGKLRRPGHRTCSCRRGDG